MKKSLLLSVFISMIVSTTAQFRRDVRNCPIPDRETEVLVITDGVCCCEFVYNYNQPSSDGRILYVEDSLELFINKTTMGGMLIENMLGELCTGSVIRMYKQDDPTGVYRHFRVDYSEFIDPIYEFKVSLLNGDGELDENFCLEFDFNCNEEFPDPTCIYDVLDDEDSGVCAYPSFVQIYSNNPDGGLGIMCLPDDVLITSSDTTFGGMHYQADYSPNFTDLSVPHVGFVNGLLNGYVPCTGTIFGQGISGAIEYVYTGLDPDTFMYCNSPVGNFRFFQGAPGNIQLEQFDGDLQKSLMIENDPQAVKIQVANMVDFDFGKVQCGEDFAEMSISSTSANTEIRLEPNNIVIEAGPSQNFRGAEYTFDFSADYTDRSLVDKEFVDDSIAALQMPNIAPATAGDIVAKFNTLLTYLIAAGLMAP